MATKVVVSFEVDNAGAVSKIQQVKRELNDVPQSTAKATSGFVSLKNALAGIATVFATVKIGQFLRESVQAAKEEQETFVRLAATLASLGVEYNKVAVELQGMFENIQATTRFADDEAAGAFQRLLAVTGDYGAAMKLLGPVMDLAVGRQMDLATAADLAGKAASGYTGLLARYGIVLDETTKKQLQAADAGERAEIVARVLNERFGGQAQANLQSYAAQMEQLGNYWEDLKEAIGATIISMAQFGGKLMSLQDLLKSWKDIILDIGQYMVTVFNADYGAFFRASLLKVEAAFQLFFVHTNDALSKLPEWLGGRPEAARTAEQALARYLEIMEEFGTETGSAFDDAIKAGEEWRKTVENLTISTGNLADVTGDGGGAGGGEGLAEALSKLTERIYTALHTAQNQLVEYNEGVIDEILERWRERYPVEFPDIIVDAVEATGPAYQEMADNSYEILSDSFSDLLGKGFMGELDSFADLWDEIWQDLAKSMAGIIGDALERALSGESGAFSGLMKELKGNLGALIGGVGMVGQAYQSGGGGWGGALQGAMGGAMAGAYFGWIGAAVGAVVGGVIGYFGKAAENPETFIRDLGLDSGFIDTRGHQGYSTELRELWIKQQQSIMRSYIQSYRSLLSLFEDRSLFELIGETPTFSTEGWAGMGADQLAQWLQKEFWPSAFMDMFQAAISEGLSGLGVSSGTLDQLWAELEALPGEERMGALTTYVASLVDLSHLVADMDWNAIMDVVGADSMTTFMTGIGEISETIDTLMMALDDMTLLERAQQAQDIEGLIVQIRTAEIQYLQQIDSMQKGINASIASQIEQLEVGGMGPIGQRSYYQQRIAEIMALLGMAPGSPGAPSSPEQIQQLMADLQRYIAAMGNVLGDALYQPIAPWGGQTWAEYLSGILTEAQGYSDIYFDQFRDEIREANDALIDAIRDLIEALTGVPYEEGDDSTPYEGGSPWGDLKWSPGGGGQPQVNVYLDGSMSALRPFVRAEIRDSLAGRSRGIN